MSSQDIRRAHYDAGVEDGTKEERERMAVLLDGIVSSPDLQGEVMRVISELRAPASAGTKPAGASPTRGTNLSAPRPTGDLGDQIVARMRASRGKAGAR